MIQKAIDILKQRWPEVMLVVVLQAALMIFSDELMRMSETMTPSQSEQFPFWAGFLMGAGSILFVTVWMMLYLGFLKTSAVAGTEAQQPIDLVRRGRPYFWKIFFFQILIGFVMMFFSGVVMSLLGWFIWRTEDLTKIPEWFSNACVMVAIMIMMKPILFIPARIIVYDNTVLQSILAVRQYRLNDIDHLFRLMIGGVGVILVFMFLSDLADERTPIYYVLSGVHHILFSLVFLLLTLTAVVWLQKQLEIQQAQFKEGALQE